MTGGRTEQVDRGVTAVVQAVLRSHSEATTDHRKDHRRRTVAGGHRSLIEDSMDKTGRHHPTAAVPEGRHLLGAVSMDPTVRRAAIVVRAVLHLHKGATMGHPKGRRETAVALAGRLLLDEALMEQKVRRAVIVVLVAPHLLSADLRGQTFHLGLRLQSAARPEGRRCAPRVREISRMCRRRSIGFSEIWKP
jgi:hypothetical protein